MPDPIRLRTRGLEWLLQQPEPEVRYLAQRDLLARPADDPALRAAQAEAYSQGRIAAILAAQHPDGYWVKPGSGYNPKYRSSVWALILLAQLGASVQDDPRVALGCEYLLQHTLCAPGMFTATGAPSGAIDCLQGNLCWALLALGVDPARLEPAVEWMARSQTGEGMAPATETTAQRRYYAYKRGPGYVCGVNESRPCAWGAVKVMLAFSRWPRSRWTPLTERAVQAGVDLLLGVDPVSAAYAARNDAPPNRAWWKFGFPIFYVTDLLQLAEALVGLGYGSDPRLAGLLALVAQKQDAGGWWALEYDYTGKTYTDFGVKKQPSPWVTLRALRVLSAV